MNEFVSECRREWKRLGVSRRAADDMAAELAADLAEAQSADELLGPRAVDARTFAREWASARGIVGRTRRSRVAPILALLALAPVIAGAVLLYTDSHAGQTASPIRQLVPSNAPAIWIAAPSERMRVITAARSAHDAAVLLQDRAALLAGDNASDPDTLGLALLIGGVALLVPSTLISLRRVSLHR